MAPLRLTCFLLSLLLTTAFSIITAHELHEDGAAAAVVGAVSKGKGVLDVELTSTVAKGHRLGGKRMGSVVQLKKAEKVKESVVSGQGSQLAAGEGEDQRKMYNVACRKGVGHEFSKEVYQKEFAAFNADYRAPRHHPPKNN